MTKAYTLTQTTWTAITAAGENGTCWLTSGEKAVIDHSKTGSTACAVNKAYPVWNSMLPLQLIADDATDIFYAMARTDSPVVLAVDV